jgi:hypothetical protein
MTITSQIGFQIRKVECRCINLNYRLAFVSLESPQQNFTNNVNITDYNGWYTLHIEDQMLFDYIIYYITNDTVLNFFGLH